MDTTDLEPLRQAVQAAPEDTEARLALLHALIEAEAWEEADAVGTTLLQEASPPATVPFAPVTKTGLPAVVLATPGAPDPADPGVMPSSTPLTVPPPLVPISGSGGGFISTPS